MKARRAFKRPWRSVAMVVALHLQLHHLATQGGAPMGGSGVYHYKIARFYPNAMSFLEISSYIQTAKGFMYVWYIYIYLPTFGFQTLMVNDKPCLRIAPQYPYPQLPHKNLDENVCPTFFCRPRSMEVSHWCWFDLTERMFPTKIGQIGRLFQR